VSTIHARGVAEEHAGDTQGTSSLAKAKRAEAFTYRGVQKSDRHGQEHPERKEIRHAVAPPARHERHAVVSTVCSF
jgi:hypothetical protein